MKENRSLFTISMSRIKTKTAFPALRSVQDAQDLKIEILNLPDGYTSNADSITLGIESGTKMITLEKK